MIEKPEGLRFNDFKFGEAYEDMPGVSVTNVEEGFEDKSGHGVSGTNGDMTGVSGTNDEDMPGVSIEEDIMGVSGTNDVDIPLEDIGGTAE